MNSKLPNESYNNVLTTQAENKIVTNFENTKSTNETTQNLQKLSEVSNLKTNENEFDNQKEGIRSTSNLNDKSKKNINYPFTHRDIKSVIQDPNSSKKTTATSYLLTTTKSNNQLGLNEKKILNQKQSKKHEKANNIALKGFSKQNSKGENESFFSPLINYGSGIITTLPAEMEKKLLNKKGKKIIKKSSPHTNSAKTLLTSHNKIELNKSNYIKNDEGNKILITNEVNSNNDNFDNKMFDKRSSSNKVIRKQSENNANENVNNYLKTNVENKSSPIVNSKSKPKTSINKTNHNKQKKLHSEKEKVFVSLLRKLYKITFHIESHLELLISLKCYLFYIIKIYNFQSVIGFSLHYTLDYALKLFYLMFFLPFLNSF